MMLYCPSKSHTVNELVELVMMNEDEVVYDDLTKIKIHVIKNHQLFVDFLKINLQIYLANSLISNIIDRVKSSKSMTKYLQTFFF